MEENKYFIRKDCPWFVEFVSPPVAVGNEPIHNFSKLKTKMGTITMLKAIDSVKDRLSSFYHWSDRQGLNQAISICKTDLNIDFKELKRWSLAEGHQDKFQVFCNLLKATD